MTLVAGVDVGNTTTEVVLVETATGGPVPVAWDRAPTRGPKGSATSLRGAAVLLRRLERRVGRTADLVAMAPLRPVRTSASVVPVAAPPTGRLQVVHVGGATAGGAGAAVGVPLDLAATTAPDGPVVLLVPAGTGFAAAVPAVEAWLSRGTDVRGVLLADDEAVLVSHRLSVQVPVLDEVDVDALRDASLVALEVRGPGHRLTELGDPIRLSDALGLAPGERAHAGAVADLLGDASRGVVALHATARPDASAPTGTTAQREPDVDDRWSVAVREIVTSVSARVDAATSRAVVTATLHAYPEVADPSEQVQAEVDGEVRVVATEAVASRVGAVTTPGAAPDALVVDLGGGTVDVVAAGDVGEVVVAGAGEMLTVAVATLLGLPRGAADWVKRGPASRLEAPQVLLAEDGLRTFLDRPAASSAVGSLVVPGPAGLLPFAAALAPSEWRALRRRTKERVVADNVVRALQILGPTPTGDVLLVGGAAADEELVGLLRPALGGASVGRGDVAGLLGHRYAVAYGLALLAAG